MAVLIKIWLWILLALCIVVFGCSAYDIVWKNKETGWRAFDLMVILSMISLIGRVIQWLF